MKRAGRRVTRGEAAAVGVAIGLLTGIIGAGGGFVIVPAPVLLSGLPMRTAAGTSLLVIAMNSFAGFAGTLSHATIHWSLALTVTAASVVVSLVGAALAGRVKPESLRSGFAWFVLAMTLFMAVKELPSSVMSILGAHVPLVALAAIGASLVILALSLAVRARGARSAEVVRSFSNLQLPRHRDRAAPLRPRGDARARRRASAFVGITDPTASRSTSSAE